MKGIVGGGLARNGSDYQADCEAEGWCRGQGRIMIEVDGGVSKKCQEEMFQCDHRHAGGGSGDVRREITGGKKRVWMSLHRARNYTLFSPE